MYGKEGWLDELEQELKKRTYQPLPVRRVYIPKPHRAAQPRMTMLESRISPMPCLHDVLDELYPPNLFQPQKNRP